MQDIMQHTLDKLMADIETRDHRITQLAADLSKACNTISSMADQLKANDEQIDRWIDGFDMVQDETGAYCWREGLQTENDRLKAEVAMLQRDLNSRVNEYNAVVAPRKRNFGRPLLASPAQRMEVLKRHVGGESLRRIADATGLGLQTVRTVIDKADRVDRSTLARVRKIEPNKMAVARDRSRKRIRDAIPKQLNALKRDNAELIKVAKGLAQQG